MKNLDVISVDIGGTNLRVALVDSKGSIKKKIEKLTCLSTNPEDSILQLIEAIEELKQESNVCAIGIGVAGQIDTLYASVTFAPNLKWNNIALKERIEKVFHIPTFLINDVRAATIGEWIYGSAQNSKNIFCLFIGTGIGGGFISNGNLIHGYNNSAGEIGHMIVDLNGPICTCGNKGCAESIASGWAIANYAKNAIKNSLAESHYIMEKVQGNLDQISAKTIVSAFHEGDPFSEKIISHVYLVLTAVCINIVNVFNPEKLIIGGGLFFGLPEAIVHIQSGVFKYGLSNATRTLDILPAKLKNHAGIIGSAHFAREKLKNGGINE